MFEKKIIKLLDRYLGDFVEGITKQDLNISIFSGGKVHLKNLRLKETALDYLGLPLTVRFGRIGNLLVQIPLTSLKSKHVVVELDRVMVVVGPRNARDWDADQEQELEERIKQSKLARWEKECAHKEKDRLKELKKRKKKKTTSGKKGFLTKYLETIIGNVQVRIRCIHIRYEDSISDSDIAFSMGFTADEISILTTDADWRPGFVKHGDLGGFFRKLLLLNNLSVYMNREQQETLKITRTPDEWQTFLFRTVFSEANRCRHEFMVRPFCAEIKMRMQDTPHLPRLSDPLIEIDGTLDGVFVDVKEWQYRCFLQVLDYFSNYEKMLKFRRYRPSVRPLEKPLDWWKYALSCVRTFVQAKSYDWELMQQFIQERKEYIIVYKRTFGAPLYSKPNATQLERFRDIESRMHFEDLILLRSLAKHELALEFADHRQFERLRKQVKKEKAGNVFKRMFRKKSKKDELDREITREAHQRMLEKSASSSMSEKERMALSERVGTAEAAPSFVFDDRLVQIKMSLKLEHVSVSLYGSDNSQITLLQISNLFLHLAKRAVKATIVTAVQSLEIFDLTSSSNKFTKIIQREASLDPAAGMEALINLEAFIAPEDGVDVGLNLRIKPLQIVFNAEFVQSIIAFVSVPRKIHQALTASAWRILKKAETMVKKMIKAIMEERASVIVLDALIQAPKIMIPDDPYNPNARLFILDLGTITAYSDVEGTHSVQDKSGTSSERDPFMQQRIEFNISKWFSESPLSEEIQEKYFRRREDDPHRMLYNRFLINIDGMFAGFGHAEGGMHNIVLDADRLVVPASVLVRLDSCVAPFEMNLPEARVTAVVPDFEVRPCSGDIASVLRIANSITGLIENPVGNLSFEPVVMEGDLKVFNPKTYDWLDRFCVLRRNHLFIYKTRVDTVFQEMVVLEEETKILYVDEQADIAVFQILTPQKVESGSKKHRKSSGARVVRLIAGDHHSRQSWVNALTENIPVNLDIWATHDMVGRNNRAAGIDPGLQMFVPEDFSDTASEAVTDFDTMSAFAEDAGESSSTTGTTMSSAFVDSETAPHSIKKNQRLPPQASQIQLLLNRFAVVALKTSHGVGSGHSGSGGRLRRRSSRSASVISLDSPGPASRSTDSQGMVEASSSGGDMTSADIGSCKSGEGVTRMELLRLELTDVKLNAILREHDKKVDLSIHDLWVLESARKEYFPLLAETYPFTICRSTLLESSASAPPLLDISFFQASEESPDANGEARIHFHCDFLGLQVSFHPETVTMFGNSVVHALKQAQTMQRHLSKALRNRSSRSKNVSGIQKPEASGPPAVSAQSQGPHDHESVMRMVQSLLPPVVDISFKMNQLCLQMLDSEKVFSQFEIADIGTNVQARDGLVSCEAGIGHVCLLNFLRPDNDDGCDDSSSEDMSSVPGVESFGGFTTHTLQSSAPMMYQELVGVTSQGHGHLLRFNLQGQLSREPLNGGEQSGLEKLSTTEDAIFSPEYDAEATLHISGIRVVLLQGVLVRILEAVSAGVQPLVTMVKRQKLRHPQLDTPPPTVTSASDIQGVIRLVSSLSLLARIRILVESPVVVIPRNETSQERFEIKLGELHFSNDLKEKCPFSETMSSSESPRWIDQYVLQLQNTSILSYLHPEVTHVNHALTATPVLSDFSIVVTAERLLPTRNDSLVEKRVSSDSPLVHIPLFAATVSVGNVQVRLSHFQYMGLLACLDENVLATTLVEHLANREDAVLADISDVESISTRSSSVGTEGFAYTDSSGDSDSWDAFHVEESDSENLQLFDARDAFVEERQEEPKRRHSHHDALLQEIQDQSETKFSEESSSVSSTDEAREQGVLHQENSPVLCAPITARNLSDHRNSFTAEASSSRVQEWMSSVPLFVDKEGVSPPAVGHNVLPHPGGEVSVALSEDGDLDDSDEFCFAGLAEESKRIQAPAMQEPKALMQPRLLVLLNLTVDTVDIKVIKDSEAPLLEVMVACIEFAGKGWMDGFATANGLVGSVAVRDCRENTRNHFRDIVDGRGSMGSPWLTLALRLNTEGSLAVKACMDQLAVCVVPSFLGDAGKYFVHGLQPAACPPEILSQLGLSSEEASRDVSSDTGHFHTLNEAVQGSVAGENPQQETGDLYLEEDFELEEDLLLHSGKRLLIMPLDSSVRDIRIRGNGHTLIFGTINEGKPLILLAPLMRLHFVNIVLRLSDTCTLESLIFRGSDAHVFAPHSHAVTISRVPVAGHTLAGKLKLKSMAGKAKKEREDRLKERSRRRLDRKISQRLRSLVQNPNGPRKRKEFELIRRHRLRQMEKQRKKGLSVLAELRHPSLMVPRNPDSVNTALLHVTLGVRARLDRSFSPSPHQQTVTFRQGDQEITVPLPSRRDSLMRVDGTVSLSSIAVFFARGQVSIPNCAEFASLPKILGPMSLELSLGVSEIDPGEPILDKEEDVTEISPTAPAVSPELLLSGGASSSRVEIGGPGDAPRVAGEEGGAGDGEDALPPRHRKPLAPEEEMEEEEETEDPGVVLEIESGLHIDPLHVRVASRDLENIFAMVRSLQGHLSTIQEVFGAGADTFVVGVEPGKDPCCQNDVGVATLVHGFDASSLPIPTTAVKNTPQRTSGTSSHQGSVSGLRSRFLDMIRPDRQSLHGMVSPDRSSHHAEGISGIGGGAASPNLVIRSWKTGLRWDSVLVLLVDDSRAQDTPLLRLQLQKVMAAASGSWMPLHPGLPHRSALSVEATLVMEVHYFHKRAMGWEPVMEPWQLFAQVDSGCTEELPPLLEQYQDDLIPAVGEEGGEVGGSQDGRSVAVPVVPRSEAGSFLAQRSITSSAGIFSSRAQQAARAARAQLLNPALKTAERQVAAKVLQGQPPTNMDRSPSSVLRTGNRHPRNRQSISFAEDPELPSLANPPAPSQNYSIPSVQDMRTHIVVTSPYSLDLNVTHGLIDVALNTAEIMDSIRKTDWELQDTQSRGVYHELLLVNHTGVDMEVFQLSATHKDQGVVVISPQKSCGFAVDFQQTGSAAILQFEFMVKLVGVEIHLPRLDVESGGVQCFPLPGYSVPLIVETKVTDATRVVEFKSIFEFHNHVSSFNLSILCENQDRTSAMTLHRPSGENSTCLAIPLSLLIEQPLDSPLGGTQVLAFSLEEKSTGIVLGQTPPLSLGELVNMVVVSGNNSVKLDSLLTSGRRRRSGRRASRGTKNLGHAMVPLLEPDARREHGSSSFGCIVVSIEVLEELVENESQELCTLNRFLFHISSPVQLQNALPEALMCDVRAGPDRLPVLSGLVRSGQMLHVWEPPSQHGIFACVLPAQGNWSSPELACLVAPTKGSGPIKAADHMIALDRHGQALLILVDAAQDPLTGSQRVTLFVSHWFVNRTTLPLVVLPDGKRQQEKAFGGQALEYRIPVPNTEDDGSVTLFSFPKSTAVKRNVVMMGMSESLVLGRGDSSNAAASAGPLFVGASGTHDILSCHTRRPLSKQQSQQQPASDAPSSSSLACATSLLEQEHYQLSWWVSPGKGVFSRTKILHVAAATVIFNDMDFPLEIRECGLEDRVIHVQPKERVDWHWQVRTEELSSSSSLAQIRVPLSGQEVQWSSAFAVQPGQDFDLKFALSPNPDSHKVGVVHVLTISDGKTVFLNIRPSNGVPQFVVENRTWHRMSFRQQGCSKVWGLPPHSRIPYCWDDPLGLSSPLLVVSLHGQQRSFNMKKIGYSRVVGSVGYGAGSAGEMNLQDPNAPSSSRSVNVTGAILTRGVTTVLSLVEGPLQKDEISDSEDGGVSKSFGHEVQVLFHISNLGVSVIDNIPQELLYLSLYLPVVSIRLTELQQSVEVQVGNMQIDNQLLDYAHPVLLEPAGRIDPRKPMIHLTAIRSSQDTSVLHLNYLSFLVQEMEIIVDETLLWAIIRFATSFQDPEVALDPIQSFVRSVKYQLLPKLPSPLISRLIVDELTLNSVSVIVSLFGMQARDAKVSLLNNPLMNMLGGMFKNVDRAHLSFNTWSERHISESLGSLLKRLALSYRRKAIQQVYKVLLSLDILGSPMGLLAGIGTGFKDFFTEPAKGIVRSAPLFGLGVAKGTYSLVKNSLAGTFNVANKLTGSIGKGITALSMDSQYVADQNRFHSLKPKHLGSGLLQGTQSLAKGIISGIFGIFTSPFKGARKGGVGGFFKGLGQGIIGVVVKPVSGAIGFVSKTGEGLQGTVTIFDRKPLGVRVRPPRSFGRNNLLLMYSEEHAVGRGLLYQLMDGLFDGEVFLNQMPLREHLLVLTHKRLLCLKASPKLLAKACAACLSGGADMSSAERVVAFTSLVKGSSVQWTISLHNIMSMQVLNRRLQLVLRQGEGSTSLSLPLVVPEVQSAGGSSQQNADSLELSPEDRLLNFLDTLQQVWLKNGGGMRSPPVVTPLM